MNFGFTTAADLREVIHMSSANVIRNEHTRNMFKLFVRLRYGRGNAHKQIMIFEACNKITVKLMALRSEFDYLMTQVNDEQAALLRNEANVPNIWANAGLLSTLSRVETTSLNYLARSDEMTHFREFVDDSFENDNNEMTI